MLILGSNTAACHPIVWSRIRRRQAEGATVIVIDPRRNADRATAADLHLPVRPGADLPLLSAMLACLDADGLIDARSSSATSRARAEAIAAAREWTPASAPRRLPASRPSRSSRRPACSARARRAMALWSMGANQSTVGTLKNRALINLCLATGNIGRPGSGPLSLTGQPNAMGGRETGGLADLLPGYRHVDRPRRPRRDAAAVGHPGRRARDHPAAGRSPRPSSSRRSRTAVVKVVWIVATNPVVSQPDAQRFAAALRRAELVIVQDAYHPTETGALAHVLLPAAGWAREGRDTRPTPSGACR